jgi:hypothetical protein
MTPVWLTVLVIAAALFALCGLAATIWATRRFGPRSRLAPPAGGEWKGVRYALFAGMMPWAKESTRRHLPTFMAGIVYHLGIAAGFLVLIAILFRHEFTGTTQNVLSLLTLAGAAAGIGLFERRALTLSLRAISTPDDFISNGLVTVFLVASAIAISIPRSATVFLIIATLLLLYIPLGKIRHCLLFFHSRATFGRFFGRRGVLPPQAMEVRELHGGR